MFLYKTSIVNNFKSVTNWIIWDISFLYAGISSVRFAVQIPIFSKFLRAQTSTQERKARAKHWMGCLRHNCHNDPTKDQLLLGLSHTQTTITEKTESSTNETKDELVCLCCSDFNDDRCWQLIWEETTQKWDWNSQSLRNHSHRGTHREMYRPWYTHACRASVWTCHYCQSCCPSGKLTISSDFNGQIVSCGLRDHRIQQKILAQLRRKKKWTSRSCYMTCRNPQEVTHTVDHEDIREYFIFKF